MTHIKKPKETFIMNFKLHERLAWKMAAGDKGAILYEFYTWKNEMMRRVVKLLIVILAGEELKIISMSQCLTWQ